ncbi:MAG: type II secretion system F family protein [Desulfobaccales bacterium]|nr:type II secretion system F family protein [Desulfobaccales bacterium]
MDLFPILVGLLVAGTLMSVVFYFQGKSPGVRKRLPLVTKSDMVRTEVGKHYLPMPLIRKLEDIFGLRKDNPRIKELKLTLLRAGFTSDRAVSVVMGFKLGLPLVLPILASQFLFKQEMSKINLLLAFYVLFVSGYFLPNLVLGRLVESRKKKIRGGLPDTLDLMVVCVEAGQGLNAALKRVAEEMMFIHPTIAQEVLMVNLEISAGMDREQALRNLGDRTGLDEMISLCNILIQSERFGTSIAQTLRVQSDILRTSRRQKLEELAAKTPVKLLFPLLLLILPAIMVVILGPAVIRISENLFKQ